MRVFFCLILLLGVTVSSNSSAAISRGAPLGLHPDVPYAPPQSSEEQKEAEKAINHAHGRCIEWKKVCGYRKYCLYRQPMKKNGCWICRKKRGARHTWHLYPRETVRQTCQYDRKTYFHSVGYYCTPQYRMGKCSRFRQRKYCDDLCVKVKD